LFQFSISVTVDINRTN